MSKLKKIIQAFFGISNREFSGFRFLIFTALICSFSLILINHYTKLPYTNYKEDARILDSLLLLMEKVKTTSNKLKRNNLVLEKFDPNSVSPKKLISFGFPKWLANRVTKYRATGALFYQPKDLLKIYGFPDSLYLAIKSYVIIKKHKKKTHRKNKLISPQYTKAPKKEKKKPMPLPIFNLNTADTAILKTISGVGSKLATRIIAYRVSLGGFISHKQLYQVYRLDSTIVNKIMQASIIAPNFKPKKININTATKAQMAAHPYINWTQAKLIISYRNQHGVFKNLENLLHVYSIDKKWIKNNAPYLTF